MKKEITILILFVLCNNINPQNSNVYKPVGIFIKSGITNGGLDRKFIDDPTIPHKSLFLGIECRYSPISIIITYFGKSERYSCFSYTTTTHNFGFGFNYYY